jgi:fatty-acyl-CoA synthase
MICGDLLGERARLSPEATALVYVPTGERLTYRVLNERSIRCAVFLTHEFGLQMGDRVGILAQNCVEFVETFFACGKSGVVLVPLNYRLTARELEHIVRDSGMRALLFEEQYADTAAILDKSCKLEKTACLDGEVERAISYKQVTSQIDIADWKDSACTPEIAWCILYTSGTTGKPKGVIIPHRMVLWNAFNTALSWQLRDSDIAPIITPLCHAGGLGVFLTPIFSVGGTIVLHRGFDAPKIWQTIEMEHCTLLMAVPTIFKMLMDTPEFHSVDISSVRWMISGGAPLPLYLIEAYQKRGITFKQGYGLTEVGVNCFTMSEDESRRKLGSIGKPMMFTEARLIDSDGDEVVTGEVGELCLRGPHVCNGYWNNPEATAAALDKGGWWHTGDTARRDSEGYFYIAGRAKDMFISGGVNVYPAEVESELLLHPAVQDVAVIGRPDATWGEIGVGFVVLRPGLQATGNELSIFLASRLAKFKIPREWLFIPELPRTPYGKVVKRELEDWYVRKYSASASQN